MNFLTLFGDRPRRCRRRSPAFDSLPDLDEPGKWDENHQKTPMFDSCLTRIVLWKKATVT